MTDKQRAFYNMCVEILDNGVGVSAAAYVAMLHYAADMNYYHTEDMLHKYVEATDGYYYLPEGFERI